MLLPFAGYASADPKGDLVEAILERLPEGCEERTCVIDPDDRKDAVGLNVLAGSDQDLVVDHVAGVFKRIYEPWWGPRTDDVMRAACLTLAQIPGATLAEVPMLLTDIEWRQAIRQRLGGVRGACPRSGGGTSGSPNSSAPNTSRRS